MTVTDVVNHYAKEIANFWNRFADFLFSNDEFLKKENELEKEKRQAMKKLNDEYAAKEQALVNEYYVIFKEQDTSEGS